MFIQGQDLVKKELVKRFPIEDFVWINDIFPEEEDKDEDGQDEERLTEDHPSNTVSNIIIVDEI